MRRAQDGDSLRSSTLKCRIHSDQSSFVLRCDDSQANFNALSSTCTNDRHSVTALANKGFHFQENKTREKRDPDSTMRQVRNKEREYIYIYIPEGVLNCQMGQSHQCHTFLDPGHGRSWQASAFHRRPQKMQLPQERSEGPEAQAPVSVVVPLLHQTVNADTMKIQPHSIISKMKCIPALFQK